MTKLVLGTVQLGMKYGLHNTHGQPTTKEAFEILDTALAEGIDTFDTAWAYGTAEDVIGGWIKERGLAGKVNIISKMKPHAANDYPDGTPALEIVEKELYKSLERLNVKELDGYLFHSPHYIYMSHLVEGMRNIKKKGLVKKIGVSVYNEPEALQAVELPVDYVQAPYNAFDQRLERTNFFDIAKKNNVTVYARSPFLQGLLLLQPTELPEHLAYLHPKLEQFIRICSDYQLSQVEAAFEFALSASHDYPVVFGAETKSQLDEEISWTKKRHMNKNFVSEIQLSFKDLNHGAINPSLWSKIKGA